MKMIGILNGSTPVFFDDKSGTVNIYGTHIRIIGCKDEREAKEAAKKNLKNFEEVES